MRPLLHIMGSTQARHNCQHVMSPAQKWTLAALLDELVANLDSHFEELEEDAEF